MIHKKILSNEVKDILYVCFVFADLSDYYPSVEWEIYEVPAKRHVRPYPNRVAPGASTSGYVDITYTVVLRRLPLFYMVNVVLPCVALLFLTILDFYLPSECGEKIALSISILVCLTVFFLLLTESFPANSDNMPLIGKSFHFCDLQRVYYYCV